MKAIQHGTEWFPAFAQDGHHRQATQRQRQGTATYSVIRNRRGPPGGKQFSFDEVITSELPLDDARALSSQLDREVQASAGPHFSSWTADVHFIQLEPPVVHPWDTGGRGPAGSSKAGLPVLWCPHCRVTFYLRPTRPRCPSCSKLPPSPAQP